MTDPQSHAASDLHPSTGTVVPPAAVDGESSIRWYGLLNRYHWFVLFVAALGWMLDCFDQQLFVLARNGAITELSGLSDVNQIKSIGGVSTALFMIGWAVGGLFFGVLGDRIGRAKTMLITVLVYSVCTGLSGLSVGVWDFNLYRFLTGLGVGGEFAVGVALVAEAMPPRARPYTLALLQACSAIGNIAAALLSIFLAQLVESGRLDSTWRPMFFIGAVPALLCILIRFKLKEPERWTQATDDSQAGKQLGSYRELFGTPRYLRHAIVGLLLASAGVVGLWGIGFYSGELVGETFRPGIAAEVDAEEQTKPTDEQLGEDQRKKRVNGRVEYWKGINQVMLNLGAFVGMYGFGYLSQGLGRRQSFVIGFLAAGITTASFFWFLSDRSQVFWLTPLMGFCLLSLFAGFAIYLPELFPTRLRSTGTSFCYNVGRFLAASGPVLLTYLANTYKAQGFDQPLRYAGVTMCAIFLIAILVLPFAPETKGNPLPE
jgi:MFS family permease